ncbi:MAG: NBR1-Ig-like domain-containing protein [Kofleriaceae bacterium]
MIRVSIAVVLAAGCVQPTDTSEVSSASTVSSHVGTGCSTAVVIGLSKQIADEIGCANPTGLVKFTPAGNLQITSNAVLPYLSATAKSDLQAVATGRVVQVNSAFRTVVQQYLLYEWYQQGRCGITAAATPGSSNHESGRAVDLANYSAVISAMGSHGWAHDVPGDDVHFDHLASPDIRGRDILAFQRLWNRNHPADAIADDGAFGPQTEARLRQAPAEGFAIGPTCIGTRDADVVSISGPDRALPNARVHYTLRVRNAGTATWPAATKLRIASGTESPLHDDSWLSATVITTLDAAVEPEATATLELDVTTPAATEELPVFQELVLDDAGTKFGDITLAVTVVPDLDGDESGESSDESDAAGGCSTTGSGGLLAMLAVLAVVGRRRRA